jgi:hypothetical protein
MQRRLVLVSEEDGIATVKDATVEDADTVTYRDVSSRIDGSTRWNVDPDAAVDRDTIDECCKNVLVVDR